MSRRGRKGSDEHEPAAPRRENAAPNAVKFPRRDSEGRVANAAEFLAGSLALLAVGLVLLVAIDGLFTLLGVGEFGRMSGWLAGILMVFLFIDDFRAWRGVTLRGLVAIFALALSVAAGSLINGLVDGLPNVFSGAIAVAIAGLIYVLIWFFGIRWSAGRFGDPGAAPGSARSGK